MGFPGADSDKKSSSVSERKIPIASENDNKIALIGTMILTPANSVDIMVARYATATATATSLGATGFSLSINVKINMPSCAQYKIATSPKTRVSYAAWNAIATITFVAAKPIATAV